MPLKVAVAYPSRMVLPPAIWTDVGTIAVNTAVPEACCGGAAATGPATTEATASEQLCEQTEDQTWESLTVLFALMA